MSEINVTCMHIHTGVLLAKRGYWFFVRLYVYVLIKSFKRVACVGCEFINILAGSNIFLNHMPFSYSTKKRQIQRRTQLKKTGHKN